MNIFIKFYELTVPIFSILSLGTYLGLFIIIITFVFNSIFLVKRGLYQVLLVKVKSCKPKVILSPESWFFFFCLLHFLCLKISRFLSQTTPLIAPLHQALDERTIIGHPSQRLWWQTLCEPMWGLRASSHTCGVIPTGSVFLLQESQLSLLLTTLLSSEGLQLIK